MSDVTISEISKSFGDVKVIHDLSIAIEDGEFVALVGPSGCGKSTLLRMIAGLEDPSSGEIAIAGQRVNEWLPKDRDVAMVFQSYALYPHMTVGQNMSFALELEKRPKKEIQAAVAEASSILGLDDYLDRKPKALSGGQRQRVAMGRAIVRNPAVFLFDEPLSNLDAKLRTVMRKEVKRLHQRLKTTSIYVTHDQTEAMTMADRIVVMQGGVIEQIGTPMELYKKPDNLFVAGFIGAPQMNLFTGHVDLSSERPKLNCSNCVLPLPDDYKFTEGQELVLGIRPEHLFKADDGAFSARVDVVEPMGSETHLTCAVGDEEIRLVANAEVHHALGDVLRPSYALHHTHLFDANSGARLKTISDMS